ncbi:MAG TPA: alpha/beta hydrolase [Xanthobacteraceae bacterium]|nr:alpha/beta hydrolase [Xanthobacteraceae bacterium]
MVASGASRFVTAPDGLKLHLRDYGDRRSRRLPVVCLPGLSRTAEDFDVLATAIATDATAPRRALALDYRGRGLSDYDPKPEHYAIPVELADVIAVLVACGAMPAIIVGTSRGGLIVMALAAKQPGAIAGAVLNDIGPVIEGAGLARIKDYVGKLPEPRSFEEGADILRRIAATQFPKLGTADWLAAAKRGWREQNGRLITTYDPALAHSLAAMNPDQPIPTTWREFEALAGVPTMVIRGANSDILSAETVESMKTRHPELEVLVVPDQGHAPLLAEPDVIARIAQFALKCDVVHAEMTT